MGPMPLEFWAPPGSCRFARFKGLSGYLTFFAGYLTFFVLVIFLGGQDTLALKPDVVEAIST